MSFPTFFDDDLPSCIDSAICPISVFDKFDDWGWGNEEMNDLMMNGARDPDAGDSLLLSHKNDPEDLVSLFSFPDILDDKSHPLADPLKLEPAYDSEFDPKLDIKEEPLAADDLEATLASTLLSVPSFDEIKLETLDEAIEVVNTNVTAAPAAVTSAAVCSSVTTATVSSILSAPIVISTQPTVTSTVPTYVNSGSLIRIPVRRNPNGSVEPNFSKSGTSRPVKAVVVCPSRTKSILCNVVRSTPKGIVIQKPRSLLHTTISTAASTSTISSIAKNDATKIPVMAVNVISSKEFKTRMAAAAAAAVVNDEVKIEPTLAALNGTDSIKIEYEEPRPLTPLSQKSDDEFGCKNSTALKAVDFFSETFMKSPSPCLLDDDNFNSDSYKCLPPAVVTGQVQPTIPDVFKYTPNSSPTNNTTEMCWTHDSADSFFSGSSSPLDVGIISQGSTSGSSTINSGSSMFFNKAAINVDHDYGFTCRTPKTSSSLFSTDSLGIQTPSASEPPTDSDEEDKNLDDFGLLNDDFDSSEMERELEALKDEIRLAEHDSIVESRKSSKSAGSGNSRIGASSAKKSNSRNRKRKLASKERNCAQPHSTTATLVNRSSSVFDPAARFATAMPTTGNLKIRLPTKTASTSTTTAPPPKRRKNGSGGRIFSPTERHLHNTNEQVRRIEMRQSFEELRQLVPNLVDKPKAPKVLILQEAKAYCDELFHSELRLTNQTVALTCQQDRLKSTLTGLRKYCSDNVWNAVQKMF